MPGATPASDLYFLGMVAYECQAGQPPFCGTALDVVASHQQHPFPPLPPAVPGRVTTLVAGLTAKDPAARPASAGEVARRAGQLLDAMIGKRHHPAEQRAGFPARDARRRGPGNPGRDARA
jgi:eukaryotic-like serine/threonine-protein kinase